MVSQVHAHSHSRQFTLAHSQMCRQRVFAAARDSSLKSEVEAHDMKVEEVCGADAEDTREPRMACQRTDTGKRSLDGKVTQ